MPDVDVTFPSRTQVEVVNQRLDVDLDLPDQDVIKLAIEEAINSRDLNSPRLQEIIDGFLAASPGDTVRKKIDGSGLEYAVGPGTTPPDYERTFTQADLSVAGILPVNHGLGAKPSGLSIYDGTGAQIEPDAVEAPNPNAIALNLHSYTPIAGTWSLSIAR